MPLAKHDHQSQLEAEGLAIIMSSEDTPQRTDHTRQCQNPEEVVTVVQQACAQGWHLVSAIERQAELIVTFTRTEELEPKAGDDD